ncbi:MAG: formylglycine-generating enzyme family protein [Verrucomicrobiales bacterium]|nr:formylglycine-generating enzyme family protein [Verrucomicrobiales bacterium]
MPATNSGSAAAAAPVASPPAPPEPVLVPITNMVRIPAGSFMRLGHRVTLSRDYWIGRFEVTQEEYAGLMGRNPSHFQDGTPGKPVEKVSQQEASAYCVALTHREREAGHLPPGVAYRLPTEAEWEYACRAGSTNRFGFGDDTTVAGDYAWTLENSESKTHPVGQKRPNAWGLHDMHGNVWEWCADWFAPFPSGPQVDPVGGPPGKFKVFRGGGWDKDIDYARSGNRFMMGPSNGIYFVGFRVCLGRFLPAVSP